MNTPATQSEETGPSTSGEFSPTATRELEQLKAEVADDPSGELDAQLVPVRDGKALFEVLTATEYRRVEIEADDAPTDEVLELVKNLLRCAEIAKQWADAPLAARYEHQVKASRIISELRSHRWAVVGLQALNPDGVYWTKVRIIAPMTITPTEGEQSKKRAKGKSPSGVKTRRA